MSVKTQFKTDIAERYKKGESSYQIGKNEGCSYNAVLRELKRRGIDIGVRFWTKKEIEKLKELYPITFTEELFKEFSYRGKRSIKSMAGKLGLKKRECKRACKGCGEEFTIKHKHNREFCLKCAKKQWERDNPKNASEREKRWLQKNPEYMKNYTKKPKTQERINQYFRQLRRESPKYRLDNNMSAIIRQSLKGKKAGRGWEKLVGYTLKDLMEHLEKYLDEKMTWENYGTYWQIDHIKPRCLFKYTSSNDLEFKRCWAFENLQPLEKIANLKKGNSFPL